MKLQLFYKKLVFLLLPFLLLINGINAQTVFPDLDIPYLSLNVGAGMSDILVDGASFGLIIEPRLPLTPNIMLGSKNGISFSTDRIIALETQVYLRWNFLRFFVDEDDPFQNSWNLFIQGGIGFLGAFKGSDRGFYIRDTRSSWLGDITVGINIPLSQRWNIEPSVRVGYPFIVGFAITAGYKFPLSRETQYQRTPVIEYVEVRPPASEVIKRIMIAQVEYIIFAPDSSLFNIGIDADARALNELVIRHIVEILNENPDYLVRIEGHANPVTHLPEEIEELAVLSEARANTVANLLRSRGVREEQMVIIIHGGSRIIASERSHWNMNRRVELIVIQVNTD
jgi:outer membrane protein OmpA-like peptidoglycan-associated protein